MSKYKPLERHLRASGKVRLPLTFAQVERILGEPLPASARRHPAWWSNNEGSHVQALAWREPGYRTEQVDIIREKVVFVADDSPKSSGTTLEEGGRPPASLFGSMKGTTVVAPGVDLTQPTAPDWGNPDGE
jgi:hypothetical protein